MSEMRYESPTTLAAAVTLLSAAAGKARVLAGGTDLIVQMRSGRLEPELLVDIKHIAEMKTITAVDGAYRIGAAVSGMELMEHEAFGREWPGIVDGVSLIGSIQVKGRATAVGNLCNASPAADSVPAMIAAGARVSIAGPAGTHDMPVEEFVTGPGKTALTQGEIVVAVLLPKRPPRSGDAYLRFTPRTEMDIAVVGCGVSLTLDEKGICTQARVALGAVAERALLVPEAGAAIVGTNLDGAALKRLGEAARVACRPIDDKRGTREFRLQIASVMAVRAAEKALQRAKERS